MRSFSSYYILIVSIARVVCVCVCELMLNIKVYHNPDFYDNGWFDIILGQTVCVCVHIALILISNTSLQKFENHSFSDDSESLK